MGDHFREQEDFASKHGVTRRNVLKGVLAGAAAGAAGLPKVAQASGPTDEEQLEACLKQIREILARMHPQVSVHHEPYLDLRQDGSYRLTVQGDVAFQPFQGDGVYLVSTDGFLGEYLVREERMTTLSGRYIGFIRYMGRARAEDGGWDDVERSVRNFVRKVREVPA